MKKTITTILIQFVFVLSVVPVKGVEDSSNSESTVEPPTIGLVLPRLEDTLEADELALLERGYVWGWPLVYLHNVQKSLRLIRQPGVSGGAPVAPINRLSMLTEPIDAEFCSVPCPNRDVIYGFAMLDLTEQPVVLQVPEANGRFWIFQIGDHRTDSFAQIGSMYGTPAGHYLIVGPEWNGPVPTGIVSVIRSTTNLAYVLPRYFVGNDPPEELAPILSQVSVYPLNQYRGNWKTHNWSKRKWYPAIGETNRHVCKSVKPTTFFSDLALVLDNVPALPGEEEFYQQLKSLLQRVLSDQRGKHQLKFLAERLEVHCMDARFDFRNIGEQLPSKWTTVHNGAAFGLDFETRASVAKSNIFVNRPQEAKYFHVEQDSQGNLLSGERTYLLRFSSEELPSHRGFWTITIYDENHRLVHHPKHVGSVVASSPNARRSPDGSLTFRMQQQAPNVQSDDSDNWIPTPPGNFIVYLRIYAPETDVIDGDWIPPSVDAIHPPNGLQYVYTSSSSNEGKQSKSR